MKLRCDYCGSFISDTDEKCPYCGGTNGHLRTSADSIPKTINDLIAFCNAHKIPYEKMRFFIGQDYKGAKAFGIYKDERGDCVVYKNKADGSRVIRYEGKDEAYAVNEIYQKLRSEVSERKEKYPGNIKSSGRHVPPYKNQNRTKKRIKMAIIGAVLLFIFIGFIIYVLKTPEGGYYDYNDQTYYYNAGKWYRYDTDWTEVDEIPELTNNYWSYWEGEKYNESYDVTDFEDSEFYSDDSSGTNDNDSDDSTWDDDDWEDDDWEDDDWDYDYDSWDSGDTDWDSDW